MSTDAGRPQYIPITYWKPHGREYAAIMVPDAASFKQAEVLLRAGYIFEAESLHGHRLLLSVSTAEVPLAYVLAQDASDIWPDVIRLVALAIERLPQHSEYNPAPFVPFDTEGRD